AAPPPPQTCGFTYSRDFIEDGDLIPATLNPTLPAPHAPPPAGVDLWTPRPIAHAEPPPPYTWRLRLGGDKTVDVSELTMPGYSDNMPLFERGRAWSGPERCYETPRGAEQWTEAEAFSMYRRIAEHTTGIRLNDAEERRTVIGIRGAYPGTFEWHGNTPDYFNDTIVLIWRDAQGPHVREFPVNTDTGAHNFGEASSSSLRPNMRYHMITNWHRSYNALRNNRFSYRVRDDNNGNGHWDSDRNLWLPPNNEADYDRQGSAHNIHMGSVNAPLGRAIVDSWSAGCQVIPGMANWTEFITHAWTVDDAEIDYFLIDARDIPYTVWWGCEPNGTHDCPLQIPSLPFEARGDTRQAPSSRFDLYSCSPADESGGEVVYVLFVDREGRIRVSVDCEEPVDIDVHLLDGDNPNACLARGHMEFTYDISPGRYLIIADTWADNGQVFAGPYTLRVNWD
ncbi:hypothetical protein KKB55_14825, partial [Myxococcota bacterium]|nr:hypothetical protein [Myxococcota bacterium]